MIGEKAGHEADHQSDVVIRRHKRHMFVCVI